MLASVLGKAVNSGVRFVYPAVISIRRADGRAGVGNSTFLIIMLLDLVVWLVNVWVHHASSLHVSDYVRKSASVISASHDSTVMAAVDDEGKYNEYNGKSWRPFHIHFHTRYQLQLNTT